MVRNPRSLARRLGPGSLTLIGASLLATCQVDKSVDPSGGTLQVSPQRVVDSAALGSRAARVMTVAISNSAAGELAWTATRLGASPWLSLSAASGTAPGTLHAAADPTGLAAGVYEDTIVVTARSPARGEARIAIQFAIHPCALWPISLDVEVTGRLDAADCTGPHRSAMFADLYSFTGSAGDSVSVELESGQFAPYLILDTATAPSVPSLAESGICAYALAEPCLRYQRLPRTGTFVIEATTLVAGDSGAYRLRLFRPRPPSPVESLAQLRGDSTTAISTGGVTADSVIVLRGVASDPDRGDSLRLEVEVRPVNVAFTGVPTATGALVPAGDRVVARVSALSDNTAYHWRARVTDQTGRASAWTDYGDNAESAPDLSVAVNDGPTAPTDLGQFKSDGLAAIAIGDMTDEATAVFMGTVLDPDPGDSVRLDVEIQVVGTPFSGAPSTSSALVASGAIASVTVAGLADETAYHWRARAVDRSGRVGPWSAFGDNDEASADFHISVARAPSSPSGPGQFRVDGVTAIAVGDTIPERSLQLSATLTDANPGDQLRLEVELQPLSAPFTDAATGSSVPVASGDVGTVAITGLAENASYHWQARVVDQSGRVSAWTAFGNNSEAASDFHVRVPATQLVFAVHPGATASGAALAPGVRVAAQDAEGNTLASFTAPITVALGSNSAGGTLSGTLSVNAVSGVATFADLRIDRAGSGYTLVASATGPAAATSNAFGITPGPAAQLDITSQPSAIAESGVPFSQQPVIQLRDAAGNAVSDAGAAVEAAIASGSGTLHGTVTVLTNTSGVAAFTDLMITGPVGPHTLQFGVSGLTGVSGTVELIAGPPSQMSMQAGNDQVDTVSQTLPTTLAVRVADQFNNPVSNLQISWAVLDGGGSVNPLSSLTDANGVATTNWTLGTAMTSTDSVQLVQATGVGSPLTFTAFTVPGPVSASQTSVTAFPATITASNGSSASTLTITVRDPFGNVIKGKLVVLSATGTGNTLAQPTTMTDANGVATGTLSATVVEGKIVSVTIDGTDVTQTAAVAVIPAGVSAGQSTVTAASDTITASSGASSTTITVTARDEFSNPIEGATVVLAATGSGNTLTQPATTTDANGVATGSLSATGAGDKVVSATVGGTGLTQTATLTVIPAEVSAAQSTVVAAPATITASSGASSAAITVTAKDQFGNPIEGAAVVLAATGSGNTVTQPAATTDANGVATGSLSATGAGDKIVSATIGGTGTTQTATVTVTTAGVSAEQSTVAAAPGSISAVNGVATITVTARDPFGNPIAGAAVVLAASGDGNTLTQPGTTTNASGIATGALSATVAEPKVVSATINATAITQTAAVTVIPDAVSAAQSTVSAAPGSITAGSGVATITVTARDPSGNPIEGVTVVLAATGSGNTLTQPLGPTSASGIATGMLSATGAGDKIVSAAIAGVAVTQTSTVTVVAAGVDAAQSTVAATPETITAGSGVATITVTARDPFGNPIEGATVVLGATGSGNTLTQPATTTNASGVATGTLSATGTGDKVVSATIGGTGITQTATVTVEAAGVDAAQSTVVAAPATIVASNGASSAAITVTARDQFGNPIEGASVVLAATGSGNTLTQPATTTDASGVATGTLSATTVEPKHVSATIGGTGVTQTATVTVTPAGVSAEQSTIAAAPATIVASNGASSTTITVTARDPFGNPIEGATVVLAATGTGNTLTQPLGPTTANGVATGLLSATGAGDKVVSATIGGTSITQTATVTVEATGVDAAQSTVAAAPGSITAGSGVATITVTARDAFGNPVEGATVSLAATGSGNTLTQPATTTAASGQTTGMLSATGAGDKVVSATIGGTGVAQTATVRVTAAGVSATQSTVAASPGSIPAGSGVATITVTARDAFGNPIDDATVALTATGSGNTLTQPASTNANGVTTGTLSATLAEGKTVSVTIDGTALTQTATVTVTATGVSAAQSTVAAAPTTITASNGASTATITVTARDQFGNPIEGATVVLAATGSGNTLTQPLGLTNTSGVATGTLSATAAGDNVVSATIAGTGVTQTATVTVTPAGVSAAQSTVAAAPETITASSGASSATVTVTARDQFGNPIAGAAVVLAATGSGNVLTQPGTTNANGVATGTLSATVAEEKTVSVTIAGTGVTQTTTVTVIPEGVSAAQSTVTAAPGTITASNGASSATITVTARDQFGNLIQGATVILAANGAGNTLTQPGTTTDAGGVATGTLSATAAEDKVVSATIAGTAVTQTATVTVIPEGVSAAQSTVAASPGTVTVTGVATITVTARDQFGNAIQGATVILAASGTGNTLTQPATTTDANGVATGTLSATAAEDKVVSATIAGTAVTQTATVTVTATGVSAARSMVVAAPTAITASTGASSAIITVTARDPFDNPIQGVTVVLAATGSGNALTQPATTTDANGQATGTLSATASGDKVVSATIAGTAVTQTATVTVTSADVSAGQSTITAAPDAITASNGASSATITVTARDAFGNPIEGATVALAATGTGNTLTQPAMTTNASGEAMGTLSATTAEPKVVSATIAGTGVTQTAIVAVDAAGADAVQSTVVAAPTTITASNGASNATITVTARDQFGNLIDGATVLLAVTGTGNILTQPGATNASGVATGTLSATVAEGKTVSVTIDGIGVTQTAAVTVTAANVSAAQSTVAAAPETITVGTGVATITVTARDAFGNPIEGATVELAVTGTGNTLTQPGTTTDANGVATGTLSATTAEDKVVSATIAGTGVTQTATVTVVSAGVSAAQSTVAASPASIMAGSGVAMITVTARDGFGNPVAGATVVLAATGSGNTLTQPGTTNASGVATGTLSATAAESKTVTATVDGLAIIQDATVLVTPAAAHHLAFLVQPTSATAGASMTPPVEVEIRDEFTNKVTDATNGVTLAIASNPAGGTLTGGGPVAAVGGVASFAGLSVDKAGTGYTLAASSLGLTGATSAAFSVMAGAVSPAQSTVAAAPESVGESELSTITVTARDPFGNPIQGATVTLAVTGSATLLTQPAAATAADGAATGTLSATLSGTKVVSAVINGTPIVQTASVTVQPPPGSVVFAGAGDIGDCTTTFDDGTAALLDGIPGTVFTAGDNAYPNGTANNFTNCYEPTWGRHKARTRPSPGNHDYRTSGAVPYFAYFGGNAGPTGLGYYSYELGDWHVISLNSEISMIAGSAQEVWLRADLAANTKQCTLAYWHRPLFSSGEHGNWSLSKPLWVALQQYNAEVVVAGHDHNYERFSPQDSLGFADPTNGLREFVVGTGGTDLRAMNPPVANSEVRNSNTHGVLKLTLHSTGYEWEFMPVAGKTFTDSGSGSCH